MKKLQENKDINLRNQDAAIKNLETQIGQLTKNVQTKILGTPNASSAHVGHVKDIITRSKTVPMPHFDFSYGDTDYVSSVSLVAEQVLKVNKEEKVAKEKSIHDLLVVTQARRFPWQVKFHKEET